MNLPPLVNGYTNFQNMDVVTSILNLDLPLRSLARSLDDLDGYAKFIQVATQAGYPRAALGTDWNDPLVDLDEVEAECFPNAQALRLGWFELSA